MNSFNRCQHHYFFFTISTVSRRVWRGFEKNLICVAAVTEHLLNKEPFTFLHASGSVNTSPPLTIIFPPTPTTKNDMFRIFVFFSVLSLPWKKKIPHPLCYKRFLKTYHLTAKQVKRHIKRAGTISTFAFLFFRAISFRGYQQRLNYAK